MVRFLKKFFSGKSESGDQESLSAGRAAELRTTFRERYHSFNLLLNANHKALEVMAELTDTLKGSDVYGMLFVRAKCTAVATSVWQIIQNLTELAPGKYDILFERFKDIQLKINPYLQASGFQADGPLVIPLEQVDKDMRDLVGGKLAYLSEIGNRLQITVPHGFAITASGYKRFMDFNDLQPEIDRCLQSAPPESMEELLNLSIKIRRMIIQATVPEDLEQAIMEHYHRYLCPEYGRDLCLEGERPTVALRSSALGEDAMGISFAGQYKSVLNVSHENIIETYKDILAGKYTLTAMAYRLNRGIRDSDVAMCVGCVKMVDAVSSGVCYTTNPLEKNNNDIIINSVWGLPKSVVDGSTKVDQIVLSRDTPPRILEKDIAHKTRKYICYPEEGICRLEDIEDEGSLPSLTDDQAFELRKQALELEEFFDAPQDIEWAIDQGGVIVILQCRELLEQEGAEPADTDTVDWRADATIIWDGGHTASRGGACGPVFVVTREADTLSFPKGAVLVSKQALPSWAPLLERAAAVVTEMGSITGHLANVAREFDVPALFGVSQATEIFENDLEITVDADNRKIFEGCIESVINRTSRRRNLMQGSAVHEVLYNASRLIVPLNLTDPYSPSFSPKNCTTFHDITRFCHEKAVSEMFHFGRDHHFPERSSKQLFYNVPMNWWILNLDDGFKHEIKGKHVRIEDIDSEPMLALWEGIIAVPWEGPPIDGKGFMSVMFRATTNPDLAVGSRSKYTEQNYFMISKNYCSLASRLGFHFSSVEALVSDRIKENYVSFQFKGGATNESRKNARVDFIKEILENHDFRVYVKADHLQARYEHGHKELMLKSLRIIGYLTIHTRQLDMIMAKPGVVTYYRNKIDKDLAQF